MELAAIGAVGSLVHHQLARVIQITATQDLCAGRLRRLSTGERAGGRRRTCCDEHCRTDECAFQCHGQLLVDGSHPLREPAQFKRTREKGCDSDGTRPVYRMSAFTGSPGRVRRCKLPQQTTAYLGRNLGLRPIIDDCTPVYTSQYKSISSIFVILPHRARLACVSRQHQAERALGRAERLAVAAIGEHHLEIAECGVELRQREGAAVAVCRTDPDHQRGRTSAQLVAERRAGAEQCVLQARTPSQVAATP